MSAGLKAAAIALDQLYPALNASAIEFDTKAECIIPTSQLSLTHSAIAAMYDYSDAFVTLTPSNLTHGNFFNC